MLQNPKTILLAEDNSEFGDILKDSLIEANFKVFWTRKNTESQFKLKNQSFDLIILDVNLEDGNVDKLVHYLRDHPKDPNFRTPIILISGEIDRHLIANIGSLVQGVLVKPFQTDKFLEKVKQVLKI